MSEVVLVCVPHAGGNPSFFTHLAAASPDWLSVAIVNLPGRERRFVEPFASSLEELVSEIVDAVIQLDLPVVGYGHSMGALLLYESALALQDLGRPLVHVCPSAFPAPHLAEQLPFASDADDQMLLRSLERLGGGPPDLLNEPEMLKIVLRTLRADLLLLEQYRTPPPRFLRSPVSAFGGKSDPVATFEAMHAWAELSADRFDVLMFDGGHFYMADSPARISTSLEEISGRYRFASI